MWLTLKANEKTKLERYDERMYSIFIDVITSFKRPCTMKMHTDATSAPVCRWFLLFFVNSIVNTAYAKTIWFNDGGIHEKDKNTSQNYVLSHRIVKSSNWLEHKVDTKCAISDADDVVLMF